MNKRLLDFLETLNQVVCFILITYLLIVSTFSINLRLFLMVVVIGVCFTISRLFPEKESSNE